MFALFTSFVAFWPLPEANTYTQPTSTDAENNMREIQDELTRVRQADELFGVPPENLASLGIKYTSVLTGSETGMVFWCDQVIESTNPAIYPNDLITHCNGHIIRPGRTTDNIIHLFPSDTGEHTLKLIRDNAWLEVMAIAHRITLSDSEILDRQLRDAEEIVMVRRHIQAAGMAAGWDAGNPFAGHEDMLDYVVQQGDTWLGIARLFVVRRDDLLRVNQDDGYEEPAEGRVIWIPPAGW